LNWLWIEPTIISVMSCHVTLKLLFLDVTAVRTSDSAVACAKKDLEDGVVCTAATNKLESMSFTCVRYIFCLSLFQLWCFKSNLLYINVLCEIYGF